MPVQRFVLIFLKLILIYVLGEKLLFCGQSAFADVGRIMASYRGNAIKLSFSYFLP